MAHASDAVDRLRRALDTLAAALGQADARAVLAAEEPLAVAAAALASAAPDDSDDRVRLRLAVADAKAMLERCRVLGDTMTALGRATRGPEPYTRATLRVVSSTSPASSGS